MWGENKGKKAEREKEKKVCGEEMDVIYNNDSGKLPNIWVASLNEL